MTFLNLLAGLGALGATLLGSFVIGHSRPGGRRSGTVAAVVIAFVGVELVCLVWMAYLGWRGDDPFTEVLLPILYLCALALLLINHFGRIRHYYWFTSTFEHGTPTACTMAEVVNVMRVYTGHYPERALYATRGRYANELLLQADGRVVATIHLTDGRVHDLLHELGISFVGQYDWPERTGDVRRVSLTYRYVDGQWALEDETTHPD